MICDSKLDKSDLSLLTISYTSAGQLPVHLPIVQLIYLNVFK